MTDCLYTWIHAPATVRPSLYLSPYHPITPNSWDSPGFRQTIPKSPGSSKKSLHYYRSCISHSVITIASTHNESPGGGTVARNPGLFLRLSYNFFSKVESNILPPHKPYNCVIDLLSNTTPPQSWGYALLPAENKLMTEYTPRAIKWSHIRPSMSLAYTVFFSPPKRVPCIDCKGLIQISVKIFSWVPSTLDPLNLVHIVTKFDLRRGYNRIWNNEWKIAFSTTSGHYK